MLVISFSQQVREIREPDPKIGNLQNSVQRSLKQRK